MIEPFIGTRHINDNFPYKVPVKHLEVDDNIWFQSHWYGEASPGHFVGRQQRPTNEMAWVSTMQN